MAKDNNNKSLEQWIWDAACAIRGAKDAGKSKEEDYLFANTIKVKVKQITIRPMTRKWASCSTNGYFTFNLELLGMERSLGEYVILHELLHYCVPNHGKLWKSLMEAHMPDHERRRSKLERV